MSRISLRETYDNRSVIAQIAKVTDTAEDASETVQEKAAEINDAITEVNAAVQAAQGAVQTAEGAVTTANAASAAAQQSAQTVAGYNTRLTTAEGEIDTLQSDLNSVTLRVTTAEGNIVTIQGRVTALETADGQNVKINAINDYAVGLTGNQKFNGRKSGCVNVSDATNMNSIYRAVVNLGPIQSGTTVTVAGMFFERSSMTMFRFAYNASLSISSQARNFVGTPAGKIGITVFEDEVYLVIGGTTGNNVGCVNTCYVHKGSSLYTPAPIDAFTIAESDFIEVVFP